MEPLAPNRKSVSVLFPKLFVSDYYYFFFIFISCYNLSISYVLYKFIPLVPQPNPVTSQSAQFHVCSGGMSVILPAVWVCLCLTTSSATFRNFEFVLKKNLWPNIFFTQQMLTPNNFCCFLNSGWGLANIFISFFIFLGLYKFMNGQHWQNHRRASHLPSR